MIDVNMHTHVVQKIVPSVPALGQLRWDNGMEHGFN